MMNYELGVAILGNIELHANKWIFMNTISSIRLPIIYIYIYIKRERERERERER